MGFFSCFAKIWRCSVFNSELRSRIVPYKNVFMQRHPEEGGQLGSSGASGSPGTVHHYKTRTFLHKVLHCKNLCKLLISNNSRLRLVIIFVLFCTLSFFIERAYCSDPALWKIPAGLKVLEANETTFQLHAHQLPTDKKKPAFK